MVGFQIRPIRAFVSHRCKEYDDASWRNEFEKFLRTKEIEPCYGCLLDDDCGGIKPTQIRKAMQKSDIFIAVMTKTWVEVTDSEGWPKKEWNLWHQINGSSEPKLNRCIGLILDIDRKQVEYMQELISFPIITKTGMFDTVFLTVDKTYTIFIRERDLELVNRVLKRFVDEIRKLRLIKTMKSAPSMRGTPASPPPAQGHSRRGKSP